MEKEKREITEINGVELTRDAFQALKDLQEDNNSLIEKMSAKIADINDHFAQELHPVVTEEDKEIKIFINELSFIRRYIKDLRKPNPG
jgi:phage host-nuclease inhibitor protein Gam